MVADSGLEPERLTAAELKSDVSASSTNPAYEKTAGISGGQNERLIRFGEPYTFPGKQNQLLPFRAWFFEGLISRVLYLGGGDGFTDYARDANELARLIVLPAAF